MTTAVRNWLIGVVVGIVTGAIGAFGGMVYQTYRFYDPESWDRYLSAEARANSDAILASMMNQGAVIGALVGGLAGVTSTLLLLRRRKAN